MEPVVEFSHITMDFPGVRANEDVSFSVYPGEIFALVGENGAGKSTLMNILYGILTPTVGQVRIKGKTVTRFNPRYAIAQGVGMVHQHFMLVPSFTVAQNIVLSREPRKLGVLCDRAAATRKVLELREEYGLQVEPEAVVGQLSVGLQQRVEILKTLYRGAEVLILDEPTAVLTPQETRELFAVLRRMVEEKHMTVILITHKLEEVLAVSNRVGVLRRGRLIAVEQTRDVDQRRLAELMVGREIPLPKRTPAGEPGPVRISVEDLSVADDRGLPAVRQVNLSVRAGEILGIAAVEGNGQSPLLEAITGLRPIASGTVTVCGSSVAGLSPGGIRALGLAHVPEDRMVTGCALQADIADNLLVGRHRRREFARFGFQRNRRAERDYAAARMEDFDIRGSSPETPVGTLSGGNIQKVVAAREFSFDAPVLVISCPTRGVDIGAAAFLHSRILEQRGAGAAILLYSADLDELLRLSDRIVTLFEGRITGEFAAGQVTRAELGYYMTGDRREVHET